MLEKDNKLIIKENEGLKIKLNELSSQEYQKNNDDYNKLNKIYKDLKQKNDKLLKGYDDIIFENKKLKDDYEYLIRTDKVAAENIKLKMSIKQLNTYLNNLKEENREKKFCQNNNKKEDNNYYKSLEKEFNKLSIDFNNLQNEYKNLKQSNNYKTKEDENKSIEKESDNKIIKQLNERIEELNEIISRYPIKLLKGEKLMSVIFISTDQNIHYSIICKNISLFTSIEQLLYEEYPNYKNINNFFIVNGKTVNKDLTLNQNGISNSDIISLDNLNTIFKK